MIEKKLGRTVEEDWIQEIINYNESGKSNEIVLKKSSDLKKITDERFKCGNHLTNL